MKPMSSSVFTASAAYCYSVRLVTGDSGIDPRFLRSNQSSDLKIGSLVATLPGAWH